MTWQEAYMMRFYNPAKGFVDGTREFHQLCSEVLGDGAQILEIGAGPSNETSQFLGKLGQLHGVDIDAEVFSNDALVSARVLEDDAIPYADETFDLCVSNHVCEHVADPLRHLREALRVLRPGGAYVLRTPNRLHYVGAFSSVTPHWVHTLLANRLRGLPHEAHAPYPTHYRMNSRRSLHEHARLAGFDVRKLRMVEKEPSYGMASRALFFPFLAYERIVNATEALAWMRASMFAVLRKPVELPTHQTADRSRDAAEVVHARNEST